MLSLIAKHVDEGRTVSGYEAKNLWDQNPKTFWKLNRLQIPGYFILDLGDEERVDGIELLNVDDQDIHTKEIKVFLSSSEQGPWNEILHEILPDTRKDPSRLRFGSHGQNKGRFLKCEILDKYGSHAGLKYFGAYQGFLKTKSRIYLKI